MAKLMTVLRFLRKLFGANCNGLLGHGRTRKRNWRGGGDCSSVFGALAKFGSLRGAYGASARCNFNIYVRIVRIDEVATCNVPLAAYSMAWGAASAPLPLSICLPVRPSVCLFVWLVGAFMVKCRRRHKHKKLGRQRRGIATENVRAAWHC